MAKKSKPTLAKPGDPLITPQGVEVEADLPRSAKLLAKQPMHALASHSGDKIDPISFRGSKKRNLRDLPVPPATLNGISAVIIYTFMGVGDREIADTLNLTGQQLIEVRNHPAYSEVFEVLVTELISENSNVLRSRIAAYSQLALSTTADVMVNAEKDETRLRASESILDRAGVSPKENFQQKSTVQNSLRIIITEAKKNIEVNLDMDVPSQNGG